MAASGVEIVFESDYPPERRSARFIGRFPETVGINYDIGNSAALGFDAGQEIDAYGGRIRNVHVKDRGARRDDRPSTATAPPTSPRRSDPALETAGYRGPLHSPDGARGSTRITPACSRAISTWFRRLDRRGDLV